MTKVKITRNITVVMDGKGRTLEDGVFEIDDDKARALAADGVLEIVEEELTIFNAPPVITPFEPPTLPVIDTDTGADGDAVADLPATTEVVEDWTEPPTLSSLPSVTPNIMEVLEEAGIGSVAQLATTPAEDLIRLKYIGSARARKLIQDAEAAL